MRSLRTATYTFPFLFLSWRAVEWIGQNYLQLQPWWPTLPWNVMLPSSLAFLAGLILQDAYNKDSWSRRRFAAFAQVFDVTHCWWDQAYDPARREVSVKLRMQRRVRGAELRLWSVRSTGERSAFLSRRQIQLAQGEEIHEILFTCPIHEASQERPRFGVTGPEVYATDPVEVIVLVEMSAGWRRQDYPVKIALHPIKQQWTISCQTPESDPFLWPSIRA